MSQLEDKTNIRNGADIAGLVRSFYGRAFADPLLGPVFTDVAHLDLEVHLPIMCDFWETVLFRAGSYRRNAFTVHVDLHRQVQLTPTHFARWLLLWSATVDDLYSGPAASHAKRQGARIAASIQRRLLNNTNIQPLTIGSAPPPNLPVEPGPFVEPIAPDPTIGSSRRNRQGEDHADEHI